MSSTPSLLQRSAHGVSRIAQIDAARGAQRSQAHWQADLDCEEGGAVVKIRIEAARKVDRSPAMWRPLTVGRWLVGRGIGSLLDGEKICQGGCLKKQGMTHCFAAHATLKADSHSRPFYARSTLVFTALSQ
eukprot:scaffold1809_cov228-Pinguiococcus_pyrenoidosus.AAC.23